MCACLSVDVGQLTVLSIFVEFCIVEFFENQLTKGLVKIG